VARGLRTREDAAPGRDPAGVSHTQPRTEVVAAAWAVVLALSLLPVVIAQEVLGHPVSDDLRLATSLVVIAAGLLVTLPWAAGRTLRPLLWLFLVLVVAQWIVRARLDRVPTVAGWLHDPSFAVYMPAELALNLLVTLAVIAVLLVLQRDRRAFYLARGDVAAPAEPVRWMGVSPGTRWSTLGPILGVCITLGTLAFLVLSGTPSPDRLAAALPYLPVVLGAAALNAFNEEVTYKASLLSVLVGPVGVRNALRMVAAYFGLAHFYGIPYGVIGVVLAWFLGWILAKSMHETRGMWWAWFIHFLQDVVIFGFLAVGAIVPGGA
jgi:hypothetical protein